jgi:hypothetical protein
MFFHVRVLVGEGETVMNRRQAAGSGLVLLVLALLLALWARPASTRRRERCAALG